MEIQVSIRCILNISDVTSIFLHTCAPVPAVHFITDEDQLFGFYFSSCLRRGDDKNIQIHLNGTDTHLFRCAIF